MADTNKVTALEEKTAGNQTENWDISDFFPESLADEIQPTVYEIEIPYTKNGRKLKIKMRELSAREIEAIRDKHTKRLLMRDEKGKLLYRGRVPLRETVTDENEVARHMIAESFVFPDLKNPDLQLKYGVAGHVELFAKMFPSNKVSNLIAGEFRRIQGFAASDEVADAESAEEVREAAKN